MHLRACVVLVAIVAGGPSVAEPNSQINSAVYRVTYQCPGEPPRTFDYAGARHMPPDSQVRLEAEWYWARSRADRGAGCSILGVEGRPG